MDIPPKKKGSTHIKVDEGYRNVGNWNITSNRAFASALCGFFNSPPLSLLDVTSAAHAEFFSGHFQMPNITALQLFSLKATGKFINAPYNRLVDFRRSKLVCQSDHALFLKQLHHCRLECYHQDD
jgi:hypothetical protein